MEFFFMFDICHFKFEISNSNDQRLYYGKYSVLWFNNSVGDRET